jgi:hypothetical protein
LGAPARERIEKGIHRGIEYIPVVPEDGDGRAAQPDRHDSVKDDAKKAKDSGHPKAVGLLDALAALSGTRGRARVGPDGRAGDSKGLEPKQ